MGGRSPVVADADQHPALLTLAQTRERAEADRARCILLMLSGWTSPVLAEVFGVREDTVRMWRVTFMAGGVTAMETCVAPGPVPVKAARALEVAEELLSAPVRIGRTGRCRVWPKKSRAGPVFAFRVRGSGWCCAKRGVPLAVSAPHAEGPSGCGVLTGVACAESC